MTKMIFCQKLQKQAPALSFAPYPGDLGQKIQQSISEPGWQLWLEHQTMLINEYRLNVIDPQSKQFLQQEMIKFLFEGQASKPVGFTDPNDN